MVDTGYLAVQGAWMRKLMSKALPILWSMSRSWAVAKGKACLEREHVRMPTQIFITRFFMSTRLSPIQALQIQPQCFLRCRPGDVFLLVVDLMCDIVSLMCTVPRACFPA